MIECNNDTRKRIAIIERVLMVLVLKECVSPIVRINYDVVESDSGITGGVCASA